MTDLLVASGGGHLRQLLSLVPRLDLHNPVWVTPRSALAEGYLHDQVWYPIPNIPSRDWRGAISALLRARRILQDCRPDRIISTGAAPAPPFFLAGSSVGSELHYIESATRCAGPSMSGKMVAQLPGVHLYTQYPALANERWLHRGSIFDSFVALERPRPAKLQKAVVTLGTEGYGFRRAVQRLLRVLPNLAEVLWQTGSTDVSGLPIRGHRSVPGPDLQQAIEEADLVISHAGTGSALTAFDAGKRPLLLPRESQYGEHVDDHQLLTAQTLADRGLAVAPRVKDLSEDDLTLCLSAAITHDSHEQPFALQTKVTSRSPHSARSSVRSPS